MEDPFAMDAYDVRIFGRSGSFLATRRYKLRKELLPDIARKTTAGDAICLP